MSIRTPSFTLIKRYKEGDNLEKHLEEIVYTLEDLMQKIRIDISQGNSEHRILTSAPGTTEIEEGQVKFVDDGATTQVGYTKLNGTIRSWALT